MDPQDRLRNVSDPQRKIYRKALDVLIQAQFPFLVGGAFALKYYTGVSRDTKDIDLFILPQDYERGLRILAEAGFKTEHTFPHWLGKATFGAYQIDIIFSSGNAIGKVDALWFTNAPTGDVLGVPVPICPAEETIWSKAFVMERERYDGADILHILLLRARELDWPRLLERFGRHWRILFSYLILFGFVYPSEKEKIPAEVMKTLSDRLQNGSDEVYPGERICRGTLLSREQYRLDIEQWGFADARLHPLGEMSAEEIKRWSAPDKEK